MIDYADMILLIFATAITVYWFAAMFRIIEDYITCREIMKIEKEIMKINLELTKRRFMKEIKKNQGGSDNDNR